MASYKQWCPGYKVKNSKNNLKKNLISYHQSVWTSVPTNLWWFWFRIITSWVDIMFTKSFVLFPGISITFCKFLVSLGLLMFLEYLSFIWFQNIVCSISHPRELRKFWLLLPSDRQNRIKQFSLCYSVTVCNFITRVGKSIAREIMVYFLGNVMTWLIWATCLM